MIGGAAPDRRGMLAAATALLAAAALLAACQSEERIVSARGGLHGLPGAVSGLDESGKESEQGRASGGPAGPWDHLLNRFPGDPPPNAAGKKKGEADENEQAADDAQADEGESGEALEDPVEMMRNRLREEVPGGGVRLVSRSPSDVMYHLMTTLQNKEYDLLLDQVLAEKTKTEYRKLARDPAEAVDWLAKRQAPIADLFSVFPMGDQTPGVLLETIGPNMFRLKAPKSQHGELSLTTIDFIIERGRFRLLMIR